MNLEVITVCILLATSSATCVAMFTVWLCLGRQPYALLWALAGGGAVLQWMTVAITHAVAPGAVLPAMFASMLVVADSSLIAIAFRHRAGQKLRIGWFVAIGAVAFVGLIYALVVAHDQALRAFIVNFICALLFAWASVTLVARGRKTSPTELGMSAVVLSFAMFELAVALLALRIGSDGIAPAAIAYRTVLGIGLPASYVALAIGAVVLLITDLAAKLEALTTRDPLTGALNRRGLDQAGVSAIANARRHRQPLSILIIELQGLRAVSHHIGRTAADRLLIQAADQLNAVVREEDAFAHLDRARFCLLLTDARMYQARDVMAQAVADIAALDHGVVGLPPLRAACAVAQLKSADFAFNALLKRAEAAIEPEPADQRGLRGGHSLTAA